MSALSAQSDMDVHFIEGQRAEEGMGSHFPVTWPSRPCKRCGMSGNVDYSNRKITSMGGTPMSRETWFQILLPHYPLPSALIPLPFFVRGCYPPPHEGSV